METYSQINLQTTPGNGSVQVMNTAMYVFVSGISVCNYRNNSTVNFVHEVSRISNTRFTDEPLTTRNVTIYASVQNCIHSLIILPLKLERGDNITPFLTEDYFLYFDEQSSYWGAFEI